MRHPGGSPSASERIADTVIYLCISPSFDGSFRTHDVLFSVALLGHVVEFFLNPLDS